VNRKRAITKVTEAKNVNSSVNDVDPSRFTIHDSRPSSRFTFHVSRFFSRFTFHVSRPLVCLVFLIVVIYANTLSAPFQWDESDFIVDNPIIKDLHYFTSPSAAKGFELYSSLINRYIGFLTFALNYRIHGLSVTGYHIVNIAIHIANSILVYFLVLLTFGTPFFKTVNGEEVNGEWIKEEEVKGKVKPFSRFTFHDSRSLNDSRFTIHDSRLFIAFFSAAIFAVHPLQTEAVTYVFQRFASLVTFFYLLSLVAYIKGRIGNGQWAIGNGSSGKKVTPYSRITFLLISLVSAVLAMKTKENAFTLPVIITLYEFCFFSRFTSHVSRFLYLIPILLTLLIVPLTLMSLAGTHHIDPGSYGAKVFPRNEYLFTQFRVIVTYLRLLFFPINQNLDYDYPLFKSFFDPQVILSFLFLAAFFASGVWLVIKTKDNTKKNDSGQAGMTKKVMGSGHSGLSGIASRFTSHVSRPLNDSRFTVHDSRPLRLVGFGILWFFITLSVESSIIPLPMLLDEYRVYLPSVGLIISAVTGVFWVFSRFTSPPPIPPPQGGRVSEEGHVSPFTIHYSHVLVAVLVVVVGVLSVATYLRNDVWADNIKLWEDIAKKSPNKPRAHYNLGNFYKSLNMYDKAIEQYLTALTLKPDDPETHNNLGLVYYSLNMPDKAMEQYMTALKLRPDYSDAHNNLGLVYYSLNMPDKAVEQYLTAIKLKPDSAKAHFNLGVFYQTLNMPDKALEQYLIAIKLKPDSEDAHYNLGVIYLTLNIYNKAITELQTAVNLKPDDPEGHFNLGFAYYKIGQIAYAQRELTAALKIKPDDQRAQQLLEAVKREM
jgi:Tfp pilus assembly protein PilF